MIHRDLDIGYRDSGNLDISIVWAGFDSSIVWRGFNSIVQIGNSSRAVGTSRFSTIRSRYLNISIASEAVIFPVAQAEVSSNKGYLFARGHRPRFLRTRVICFPWGGDHIASPV